MDLDNENTITEFEECLTRICYVPNGNDIPLIKREDIEKMIMKSNINLDNLNPIVKKLEKELYELKPRTRAPFPWTNSKSEKMFLEANGITEKSQTRLCSSKPLLPKWSYEYDFTKGKKAKKKVSEILLATNTYSHPGISISKKGVSLEDFSPQAKSILETLPDLTYLFNNPLFDEEAEEPNISLTDNTNEKTPPTNIVNLLD